MARLVVRDLEEEVIQRLKERAAEHGISAEEERRILRRALQAKDEFPDLKALLLSMPPGGDETDFERVRDFPQRVDLS